MTRATLLDVARHNLGDSGVGLIEEAILATPEIGLFPVKTISGLNYYTKVRTSLPVAAFRNANEGQAAVKSEFENRLVETFILNPRWEADRAVADRAEEGVGQYLADEALGITAAAMQRASESIYYGNAAGGFQVDEKGYPGFIDSYDSTNMVVDAGGTTDNEASSVWAVRVGRRDVSLAMGNGGMMEMEDPRIETLYDDSNNPFTGYVQELLTYIGLQVGSIDSVGRIKKLTTDTGKGLTDSLMADLMAKFPAGRPPTHIFMTKRSQAQLRKSRTATTATGAEAQLPQDFDGIPIIITEGIKNTETLAL
jgi:hypothetical protein